MPESVNDAASTSAPPRDRQHHDPLDEFGGLEGDRADRQPAACTVDLFADVRDEGEELQQDRDEKCGAAHQSLAAPSSRERSVAARTASITGAYVALALALRRIQAEGKLATSPLRTPVAAVSLGVVADQVLLDLAYVEDRDAAVDLNLVMDGRGRFIELQASGEESTFSSEQLDAMLAHGRNGIRRILELQQAALSV
jgi:hypothetical protein